jgi:hypothetical protein
MTLNVLYGRTARAIAIALLFAAPALADEKSKDDDRVPPSAVEIAGWISQLDDPRYLVREQATGKLIDSGSAAFDLLLAAANGEHPEPADRAVWILRRMARSRDNDQAIAALERMVRLRGRPTLVQKAEAELDERSIAVCQAKLTPLGAEIVMEPAQFDNVSVVPLLHVRLGDKWRGTADDLQCLAQLRRHAHYRLEGEAIDDAVVGFFEDKDKLAVLYLWDTTVSAKAVDRLKEKHPTTIVYVRGKAMMGVSADNHPGGVRVTGVAATSGAAAAGILEGDIIVSMNGEPVPDFDRLTARIAEHSPGETISVEIIRNAERQTIPVTLGDRPEGQ